MFRSIVIRLMAAVLTLGSLVGPYPAHAKGKPVEPFALKVGPVEVKPVEATGDALQAQFILWGADYALFWANGLSLNTQPGSIYDKLGIKLTLVPGDDMIAQTTAYLSGKTPFWRSTTGMAGMAAEVINADPRTQMRQITQMSWSNGDHIVVRNKIKTVKDLKGTTWAAQYSGPHVELIDAILKMAKLTWNDITVEWTTDLTGEKGPAALMRSDSEIDVACVVTPDCFGLVGTPDNPEAEDTLKGVHRLIGTSELGHVIPDVFGVRADFDQAHPDVVKRFAAGYLMGVEAVVDLRKKGATDADYRKLLQFVVKTFQAAYGGEAAMPNSEEAHGLHLDCAYAGYPGNVSFFDDDKNLTGFDAFNTSARQLAVDTGYAKAMPKPFLRPSFSWDDPVFTSNLKDTKVERQSKYRSEALQEEYDALFAGSSSSVQEAVRYTFTIPYGPNENTFPVETYAAKFDSLRQVLARASNAVVAVRAHVDPGLFLGTVWKAGEASGILTRTGDNPSNYKYLLNGKPIDLAATKQLRELVQAGKFDGNSQHNPRTVMQAAERDALARANNFLETFIIWAAGKGTPLDASRFVKDAVGIREPKVPKPTWETSAQNRRVDIAIVVMSSEAATPADYDF
jgi:hypothetical protein